MNIYVKELIAPEVLDVGSEVSFILSTGERIDYEVNKWFLYFSGNYDRIFTVLGIANKHGFVQDIVGYEVDGFFPCVHSAKDLMKVIRALAMYNNPKIYITNEDHKFGDKKEEKFTLEVKKHKCLNLNFQL